MQAKALLEHPPAQDAVEHSHRLLKVVIDRIESQPEKVISFADYMQLALFAPGLGYYVAGTQKFGGGGDFTTAPEISPLFSRCIANQCYEALKTLGEEACILEIGPGSGKMVVDILKRLQELGCLPKQYYILELSAELQERQRKFLQAACPELLHKVIWLKELPKSPIPAIILANEVCDAMPAHCFSVSQKEGTKQFSEMGVSYVEGKLITVEKQPCERLKTELHSLFKEGVGDLFRESTQYISEVNLNIAPWIKSLADFLEKGLILIIDYGFPRQEYYHPSRYMGTLMCHYQHQSHSDPFFLPGLQDITAHVDFTAIAEAASSAGLEVLGFTNQASFLLGAGLIQLVELAEQTNVQTQIRNVSDKNSLAYNVDHNTEKTVFQQAQAIQVLTSPSEMGELFKVIALSKNFDTRLSGFALNDMRYRL